jgi:formylglycine-generating enzyme required for sulfatase activity
MLPEQYQWIGVEFEPDGDPRQLFHIARQLEDEGNLPGAATVYDRAYGLDPTAADVREGRQRVLDRLAVFEHGLRFCYVPGGVFLMGSDAGEPDERPRRPVWLSPYWLSETPVSWADFCRLMDWEPPPAGLPRVREDHPPGGFDWFTASVRGENKIRLQYCEDRTTRARDWHSHDPGQLWGQPGQTQTAQELFGSPERDDPEAPWRYDTKPMVAVPWQGVVELATRLSAGAVRYGLPTEAQWEKAARGGLIGARHAWGDRPPAHDCCDFDRFREFSILPSKSFAPNGYGLYAMNGGVWEWTADWYERDHYRQAAEKDPEGPAEGQEKVLRGGSWADCAEVQTVTFRMSRGARAWRDENGWGGHGAPNIGFRLCRTVAGERGGP